MAEDRPVSMVNSDYATPLQSPLLLDNAPLEPPRASYFNPGPSIGENTPRDSIAPSASGLGHDREGVTPTPSTAFLPAGKESEYTPPPHAITAKPFYRRPVFWLVALAALVAIILAVILPLYFVVIHKNHSRQSSNLTNNPDGSGSTNGPNGTNGTNTGSGNPGSTSNPTSGGDGSTIVSGNSSFTYSNPFRGYWVYDPQDPFNDGARANSWTPPLNATWNWATDRAYGVNLGGLFVLEPFITPALFQKYPGAVDEWTLSEAMAADTGPGGGLQSQLEAHYDTFITEKDLAEIAGAGLNWIRLPIPYWAIETWPGEPFLAQVCWKYILRLFGWARKYGLRIYLDLHTVPGSQNGYNHSGKGGQINFLNGIMGIANAQRTLDYIRIITEFISQPEYRNVVPMFGIINEALVTTIGKDQMTAFYLQAHDMIRSITGYGEGNGPYIAIHDGFIGVSKWAEFLPGSDRIVLDTHPYFAFDGQPNNSPITADDGLGEPGGIWPKQACDSWGPGINQSQLAFGVTIAGEFSNGFNDCGLYVLGVGNAATDQGDCTPFIDWQNWSQTFKDGLRDFSLASMDATQNWWFWTWKIDNSSTSGTVEAPLWSYQLGLENGWMPKDPRASIGKCQALGGIQAPFSGTYSAWQTGGPGAGTIASDASSSFSQWPPSTISGVDGVRFAALPTYTPTGSISTLPPPQLTPKVSESDGWFDAKDTGERCYPNAWDSVGVITPTAPCPAGTLPPTRATASATPPPAPA
ncbi:glycoside hydrolase family 5 protein [Multifurca ochricompacta]|uniref:glucan 1,3-beta-glucosidase n=1 Tax=Multifurca ochricompacta TaxID=376703 RepID=A0AAD4M4X6_9AGAM|nr:glycoside hydrolase family 5 protein [Multifurca ochricompacta]